MPKEDERKWELNRKIAMDAYNAIECQEYASEAIQIIKDALDSKDKRISELEQKLHHTMDEIKRNSRCNGRTMGVSMNDELKKDCERNAREIIATCMRGRFDREEIIGAIAKALLSEHLIVQKRVEEIEADIKHAHRIYDILHDKSSEQQKQIDELKKELKEAALNLQRSQEKKS